MALYRLDEERLVAGVTPGIAVALGMPLAVVRLVFFALTLASGIGIVLYLLMAIFVPHEELRSLPYKDVLLENLADLWRGLVGFFVLMGRVVWSAVQANEPGGEPLIKLLRIAGLILLFLGLAFILHSFGLLFWLTWLRLLGLLAILAGAILAWIGYRR